MFAAIVAAGIFENLFAALREVTVTVDPAKAILIHRQPSKGISWPLSIYRLGTACQVILRGELTTKEYRTQNISSALNPLYFCIPETLC